jgi:hypothetical protein
MNKYEITISGSGCEAVIGTIPQKISWYWQQKFEDYQFQHLQMYLSDRDEYAKEHYTPKMFDIEQEYWHDIDDILHANGCNLNGTGSLEVTDKSTGKIVYEGDLYDIWNSKNNNVDYVLRNHSVDADQSVFFGWTEEKMFCDFNTLTTNEPFDFKKLLFNTDEFRGDYIITDLIYENEVLEHNGGEGYTKCLNVDINYWGDNYLNYSSDIDNY